MNNPGQRSILLTSPNGEQSPLHSSNGNRELSPGTPVAPTIVTSDGEPSSGVAPGAGPPGVQFDSEQLERGRSRTKNSKQTSINGIQRSVSRSRSRSSATRRVKEEGFLKWTVLRRDPSMRIKLVPKGPKNTDGNASDDSAEMNEDEDDDEEDDEYEDEDDDEEDDDGECSDEEQVLDVPNDFEIDNEFHYDLGTKVLPNFVVSLNDIMDSSKAWIKKYNSSITGKEMEGIITETLSGGYFKSMQVLTKGKGSLDNPRPRSYILCTDLTSESQYALTYVMGSVINNGDTLYVLNWVNDCYGDPKETVESNVTKIRASVLHMFDCISAVIDDLDVVVLSLQHPYPKHLLTEMIFGLKPAAMCCSLSMVLSSLKNYVCSVPTLVIRKKLKRAKKKGICE